VVTLEKVPGGSVFPSRPNLDGLFGLAMAEPTMLSRPPKSPGGLVEFIHNKDTPPSTPTRQGVFDVHERRLQKLESTLSPQKLPHLVDSELEQARITKARLAKQQKAQMERSAVFTGSKSTAGAMPELQQELREKQKIIDKIDADSERHRKFTSELERWLFDLKQDDEVRAERAERLAHAEDERHSWHEQMHEYVDGFKKDMASASNRAEEIRILTGEVADEDEEESQLDRKTFELKVRFILIVWILSSILNPRSRFLGSILISCSS
jgi:hypothetical protein